ncbi:MAG: zinc-ribbon domain-containing protein [Oscillospiraceae bacterium]|nr:zinc-ribbon domain-containing protein [Oscillospiraceae bacterium]
MKYCTKCGTQNEDDSVFCLRCGNRFQEVQQPQNQQVPGIPQQPQSQLPYTVPQQPIKSKKKGKGCLIVFIVLIAFLVLTIVLAVAFKDAITGPSHSKVGIVMELNDDQATDVLSIFEQCGIGEISSVELFQASEDRTSYYVDDVETAAYSGADYTIVVWVDNATKTILEIYFNGVTIYADGEVKAQVSDYYISKESRDTYRVNAQVYVNQCLSYPDTAEYSNISGWNFGVRDGLDIVQSTVTSQNAFGVPSTMTFQVKFDRSTGAVVSLILDGKEYIE